MPPSGRSVTRLRGGRDGTFNRVAIDSAPLMGRKSLRVVVVDDNRDIVATTIALLRVVGHDAKACYDGKAVLPCIRDFDPDVVVMDIGLPGKSGWDAAREVRDAIPGKRPLLIGMSGEPGEAS